MGITKWCPNLQTLVYYDHYYCFFFHYLIEMNLITSCRPAKASTAHILISLIFLLTKGSSLLLTAILCSCHTTLHGEGVVWRDKEWLYGRLLRILSCLYDKLHFLIIICHHHHYHYLYHHPYLYLHISTSSSSTSLLPVLTEVKTLAYKRCIFSVKKRF